MTDFNVTASKGGLKVVAYPGDNKFCSRCRSTIHPTRRRAKIWQVSRSGER